jgi:hypothetical protein
MVNEINLRKRCSRSVKECLRGELSSETLRAWWVKNNASPKQTTMGGVVNCGSASKKVCRLLIILNLHVIM